MNIIGIGQDIVELNRIREAIDRHGDQFLNRCFTELERDYCLDMKNPIPHLAARFSAKEAAAKALGTGFARGVSWHDIEIRRSTGQRPTIHFSGRARQRALELGVQYAHVTLTHERELASTLVIVEGDSAQASPYE